MPLKYMKLPEDTTIECCYAFYSGHCTGAAYSCPRKAEYVLCDDEGQMTVLTYCKDHMYSEWITPFIEAGRKVIECG